ncbi:RidA family protein [Rhizobium binae]|uniref:RidA family protein n=1 Tax=Rhizobium binae TaxID=1138190 RepID=UPI001C83BD13|nr:Rid family hydrolase [Rhizobium binae]MBX4967745.1 hypothetical protein [Rhizobium binae]
MDDIIRRTPAGGPIGPGVYKAWGFSQAVSWMGMTYYAGIAPLSGDNPEEIVCIGAGSMREQITHVLETLDFCLAADRLDRRRLLSWTIYVTSAKAFFDASSILVDWVGDSMPAATLIEVSGMAHPDQMIEITAVAAIASSAMSSGPRCPRLQAEAE